MNTVVLCRALEGVPEWIELIPPGENLRGIDGREFKNPNPDALIERFKARPHQMIPIDIDHGSETSSGLNARAIGWIVELQNRDGAIWGRVQWTGEGEEVVGQKMFRFISPGFLMKRSSKEIVELTSAGVTNHPNLRQLASLNRTEPMDEQILEALGLSEGATVAEVVTAINKARSPSLDEFVPRADYQLALNRAAEAEAKVTEQERKAEEAKQAAFKSKVETVVNKAVEDGKIAPASKDYFIGATKTDEDFDRLEKHINSAEKQVETKATSPGGAPDGTKVELNADQRKILNGLGVNPDAQGEAK